jgi:hypothetical protein
MLHPARPDPIAAAILVPGHPGGLPARRGHGFVGPCWRVWWWYLGLEPGLERFPSPRYLPDCGERRDRPFAEVLSGAVQLDVGLRPIGGAQRSEPMILWIGFVCQTSRPWAGGHGTGCPSLWA